MWNSMIFSLFYCISASLTICILLHRLAKSYELEGTRLIPFLVPADPRPLQGSWVDQVQKCCHWPKAESQTNQSSCVADDCNGVRAERDSLFRVHEDLRIYLHSTFSVLWLWQYVIMCVIMCDNSNTGDVYVETLNAVWYVSCSFYMHSEIF